MKTNKADRLKSNPNTIVKGEYDSSGRLAVYLICSGKKEFVLLHRGNALLYSIIGKGVSFSELRRWNYRRAASNGTRVKNLKETMVKHLVRVIDEYIEYELIYDEPAA